MPSGSRWDDLGLGAALERANVCAGGQQYSPKPYYHIITLPTVATTDYADYAGYARLSLFYPAFAGANNCLRRWGGGPRLEFMLLRHCLWRHDDGSS